MPRPASPALVPCAVLLAAMLHAAAPETQPVSGGIDWVFDYEQGRKLARASGKPLFVVFRCER